MISFFVGFITGILFSLIAVITGKKCDKVINNPNTIKPLKEIFVTPKAKIIKTKDDVEEFLNEN